MTLHERMAHLDEEGEAYEVSISTPEGAGIRAPVMHHSERWICTATGSGKPEVWTAVDKIDRIAIYLLP